MKKRRIRLTDFTVAVRTLAGEPLETVGPHPEPEELVSYVEGAASARCIEAVREHLVACRDCAELALAYVEYREEFSTELKPSGGTLLIDDPTALRLARELVEVTGETLTDAVLIALRERLARSRHPESNHPIAGELLAIGQRCASLPDLDRRTAEEILGYDENGLPR